MYLISVDSMKSKKASDFSTANLILTIAAHIADCRTLALWVGGFVIKGVEELNERETEETRETI
jgi:hypothetical protein